MIIGAHSIIYSTNPEADRAFLREVLGMPAVDAGQGWLIFGLPPAELAVHPSDEDNVHELYLMCDDMADFQKQMQSQGIACGRPEDQGWGILTAVVLPGGGKLGVYQPRHARPPAMGDAPPAAKVKARKRPARKAPASKAARRAERRAPAKTARKVKPAAGKKPAARPAAKKVARR